MKNDKVSDEEAAALTDNAETDPPETDTPVNAEPVEPATGEASGMLQKIERDIEAKLPDEHRDAYDTIIVAGRQLMFSEKTHGIMERYMKEIQGPDDVPKVVAHGIIKLMSTLYEKSQGKLSIPASAPAAITLMTYALKYVDGQLNIDVTKPMIDATTTATVTGLFALWNISKEQVQEAIASGGKGAPTEPPATEPVPQGA